MVAEAAINEAQTGWYSDRFCELFEAYQPALRRLVSAYVVNPADREDLLQEIAAGMWKSLPGFRGESSERTWIVDRELEDEFAFISISQLKEGQLWSHEGRGPQACFKQNGRCQPVSI
jgi:hypothetical protein